MTFPRPQRLTHLCPPGSLLKQFGASTHIARKTSGDQDPAYLALVRQCPCLSCGLDPAGTAAHLRLNSALYGKRQALGRKPLDSWATPLCSGCHLNDPGAQHRVGEYSFWQRVGINPFLACQRLYAARGDLVSMRSIAHMLISERQGR